MFFFRGALFWKSYLFILRRYYIINVSIIDNSAEEYMSEKMKKIKMKHKIMIEDKVKRHR